MIRAWRRWRCAREAARQVAAQHAETTKALRAAQMLERYQVVVSLDGFVKPDGDIHIEAHPLDHGRLGITTARDRASLIAERVKREGVWLGDKLFPPHRIMAVSIKEAPRGTAQQTPPSA